ncbi:MAG: hypothetical protein WBM04_08045, partial [Candidatus Korobacteraceae bacterium]
MVADEHDLVGLDRGYPSESPALWDHIWLASTVEVLPNPTRFRTERGWRKVAVGITDQAEQQLGETSLATADAPTFEGQVPLPPAAWWKPPCAALGELNRQKRRQSAGRQRKKKRGTLARPPVGGKAATSFSSWLPSWLPSFW